MNIQDIFDYVMETRHNSNPNQLNTLLGNYKDERDAEYDALEEDYGELEDSYEDLETNYNNAINMYTYGGHVISSPCMICFEGTEENNTVLQYGYIETMSSAPIPTPTNLTKTFISSIASAGLLIMALASNNNNNAYSGIIALDPDNIPDVITLSVPDHTNEKILEKIYTVDAETDLYILTDTIEYEYTSQDPYPIV